MPTRRTSPRRSATRPRVLGERLAGIEHDELDGGSGSQLAAAAPWLALLAVVLAGAALAVAFVGRSGAGGDLTACRSAAWSAVPAAESLPAGWTLGSTDLNANGITVSIVGPVPADGSTSQAVVYASVTCYGEAAATALADNRRAAEAAGASVVDRTQNGQAYDVDNPSTGSLTTLFRVGGLIGQVADAGSATPTDLATITKAVAAAMGDQSAAGALGPDDGDPGASDEPIGSDDGSPEPAASAYAPELEALMPKDVKGTPLTVQSAPATELLGDDPSSRALTARIRALGSSVAELQLAQAFDEAGGLDVSIIGFRLPNADEAKLRAAIIETWLSAGSDGVTQTEVTLGGKKLVRVDYGDEGTVVYVYAKGDAVILIDTADPTIAEDIATKLQ
jgi:hypothetical protein